MDSKSSYELSLRKLCETLKSQMELLDDISLGGSEISFLRRIVNSILNLDGHYVKDCISSYGCELALTQLVANGEIELRDNGDSTYIFSKRGVLKKSDDMRRMSFVNTKFYDGDLVLTVANLMEMSDLDYIFSMNGYHLPFCNSTKERSMYESFFSAFIKQVTDKDERFSALLEFVCATQIITELCVDALECVFEIIVVISTRIKAFQSLSQSNSPMTTPRETTTDEVLQHLLEVMNDNNKIFSLFKCRKLLKSVNNKSLDANWLAKINNYAEALEDANEIYLLNCSNFIEMAKRLSNTDDARIKSVANDIIIYVSQFQGFMVSLGKSDGDYKVTLKAAREVIKHLDDLEVKEGTKYGTIVTPRSSQRIELSKSSSGGLSSLMHALSPRNYFRK